MNLTPKQLRILQLIRDCRIRNGYSPTMQELADEIGVSKVTVFEHVEALIKKGALTRDPNKARSLSIADGVGRRPGRAGALFALRVQGDSMRDEGILEGDYILVERTDTAANGERVVALLPNGETTLKTFFREGDRIRLQPAKPEFQPIIVKDCKVQGIVRSVLRKY